MTDSSPGEKPLRESNARIDAVFDPLHIDSEAVLTDVAVAE
jgi:hypothetical protein